MNIDFAQVEKLIEQGYISRQEHPTLPLYIFNYTHRTQFDHFWTPETMACRGLITDKDYNIVARPFPKFFNLEEHQGNLPDGKFELYEKMDGSLIIAVLYCGVMVVATRGSFVSDQAIHAKNLLREKYGWIPDYMVSGITYLMEVIYPDNRIVVDYGERDELVLLTLIDTESGQEYGLDDVPVGEMPKVKRYDTCVDIRVISNLMSANMIATSAGEREENREGYVVRWENGFRVKMKFEEYKRLHRLITGVNSKTIWEMLRDGKSLDELLKRVPDEFYQWVKETSEKLQHQYEGIESVCKMLYKKPFERVEPTRKEIASYYTVTSYPDILFHMLDGQDYSKAIWKRLRPKAEKPFKTVGEDVA